MLCVLEIPKSKINENLNAIILLKTIHTTLGYKMSPQILARSLEDLKIFRGSASWRGTNAPKRYLVFKVRCLKNGLWSTFLCKCLPFVRLQSQLSPFLGPKLKVVLCLGADKCPPYQIYFQTNFTPKKG